VTSAELTARNLLLEAELLSIVPALAASGIPSIVLKGIPLARRVFGRLDSREVLDNDILVHRVDAPRACAVIESLGYAPLDGRRIERQLDFDFQYCLQSMAADGSVRSSVDLHWNAFQPDLYPVAEEDLWAHAEPFDLRGRTILVFDKVLTIVHLAAHYAQHWFGQPSILRDVAAAWNRWHAEIDAQQLGETALAVHGTHVVDYAFGIAADLDMLTAAPPLLGSRRAARLRRWLPAHRLRDVSAESRNLRMLLGLTLAPPRQLPKWLRNVLLPPLENFAAWHGGAVSPALRVRYFARPFRAVGRALAVGGRSTLTRLRASR
jgi:hypothetical protein